MTRSSPMLEVEPTFIVPIRYQAWLLEKAYQTGRTCNQTRTQKRINTDIIKTQSIAQLTLQQHYNRFTDWKEWANNLKRGNKKLKKFALRPTKRKPHFQRNWRASASNVPEKTRLLRWDKMDMYLWKRWGQELIWGLAERRRAASLATATALQSWTCYNPYKSKEQLILLLYF